MTATAPPVPAQVTASYDVLRGLGSLGPTGDPLVCAGLRRPAPGRLGGSGAGVAGDRAVDAYGTHVEVGQPSTAALVQAAVDCSQAVAGGSRGPWVLAWQG